MKTYRIRPLVWLPVEGVPDAEVSLQEPYEVGRSVVEGMFYVCGPKLERFNSLAEAKAAAEAWYVSKLEEALETVEEGTK